MSDVEREENGRFPKGVSGNPGGRPRRLREVEAVLDEHGTAENMREVFRKLREQALQGDPGAMKLYLDRVVGPVRSRLEDEADEIDVSTLSDDELRRIAGRSR